MKLEHHNIWPFALILVIFTVSSRSSVGTSEVGFSYDKFYHFLIFGLLATCTIRIPNLLKRRWKGVLLTILFTSLYGIVDEYRQTFTEGRSVEFNDWLADTLGATVASILYFKCDWYRSILETRLLVRRRRNLPKS